MFDIAITVNKHHIFDVTSVFACNVFEVRLLQTSRCILNITCTICFFSSCASVAFLLTLLLNKFKN